MSTYPSPRCYFCAVDTNHKPRFGSTPLSLCESCNERFVRGMVPIVVDDFNFGSMPVSRVGVKNAGELFSG